MKQSFKFKAHHIETNKDYWFDVMWGNMGFQGSGIIGMLPIEKEVRTGNCIYDDRIPIDPNECEIEPIYNLCDHCKNKYPSCNADFQFNENKYADNIVACNKFLSNEIR